MRVIFGNEAPTRTENTPTVTQIEIPDTYTYVVADSAADLAKEVMNEIAMAPDGITRQPDQEALLAVQAGWRAESSKAPTWVWSDNPDFAVLLGHVYGCPVGVPDDVEDTHFTFSGPPGTGPVYTHPDDDPIEPVLEGADYDKAQPPADAGEPEATA